MIISFALAKHRLRVSQTVLLCPLDIAYLCLFYPAIIGCTSVLKIVMSTAILDCALFFAFKTPSESFSVSFPILNIGGGAYAVLSTFPQPNQHASFIFPALYLRRPSTNMTSQMYSLYYRIVRSEYENKCEETN